MIHGKFKSNGDVEYSVQIICPYDYEIGSTDEINFTDEPIEITQDISDTFEHIIKTQANINLLAKNYLGDYIFSSDDRGIEVLIYKEKECIFNGYIQPQTYNQDFADEYTEITLNCQDYLCTLENHKYKEKANYDDLKTNVINVSFKTLLTEIFGENPPIYFDNSIKVSGYDDDVFSICGISELMLLGDEEDDVWTQEDILSELLQYLNLHIVQIGKEYYIFSWNNIKRTIKRKLFKDLFSDKSTYKNSDIINVSVDLYKSDDTQISMSDVYNKIIVECDLEENDTLIQSPLDEDSLVSPYTNRNRFLVETADGDNKKTHTWYYQFQTNPKWKMRYYENGNVCNVFDLVESDGLNSINQYKIAEKAKHTKLFPMLCSFGKVESKSKGDNSKNSDLSMSDQLIITINGSGTKDINTSNVIKEWETISDKTKGIIEYNSAATGVISPTDNSVINYIVFSGQITLQPPVRTDPIKTEGGIFVLNPEVNCNWVKGKYPSDVGVEQNKSYKSLMPNLGYESLRDKYREKYGSWLVYRSQDGVDSISKIPILICQLSIGNKYCVETNGSSTQSLTTETTFEWLTIEECNSRNLQPTFALGINPALDDELLCKEFDLQNTLDVTDNIDAKGTAIPIRNTDNLSGKINFKILSPAYVGWEQQIRRHPTAFRHTKWWTTELPIMEFVENIYIQNFECKLYSNNANINNTDDKDLIYVSDVINTSIKTKDDITFKFNTALTTEEAIEKGISTNSKMSNVVNMKTNGVILNINSLFSSLEKQTAKPEEHYINDYYNEYSNPKLIIETSLNINKTSYWQQYKFNYFKDKVFFVLGTSKDLKNDTIKYTLKEI